MTLAGGLAIHEGYKELTVASGSTSEPLDVRLSELEAGVVPENKHLRIGEHWKVFGGAVYQYKQGSHRYGEPEASDEVVYLYYPIVSTASKEVQGDTIRGFSVIVRTRRYETVGAIPPDDVKFAKSVRGLVLNEIERLDAEERQLLRESFTGVNFERLILLQEGRTPTPMWKNVGIIAGGAVAILLGLAGIYRHRHEEL